MYTALKKISYWFDQNITYARNTNDKFMEINVWPDFSNDFNLKGKWRN